jgi:hypothetical protein
MIAYRNANVAIGKSCPAPVTPSAHGRVTAPRMIQFTAIYCRGHANFIT